MADWTRITDADAAVTALPAWFATGMMARRGAFGFLLTTGDVVRVSRVVSVHQSPAGVVLIDVLLDRAGVPEDADLAWRSKHYLGAPVAGATLATVNMANVVMAVEFEAAELVEVADEPGLAPGLEVEPGIPSALLQTATAAPPAVAAPPR